MQNSVKHVGIFHKSSEFCADYGVTHEHGMPYTVAVTRFGRVMFGGSEQSAQIGATDMAQAERIARTLAALCECEWSYAT